MYMLFNGVVYTSVTNLLEETQRFYLRKGE